MHVCAFIYACGTGRVLINSDEGKGFHMSRGPGMPLGCQSVLSMGGIRGESKALLVPQILPKGPRCSGHYPMLSVVIAHISVKGRI